MHLLAAEPGTVADGTQARDLGQTAGDIVFLSAADTEIALIAAARRDLGAGFPSVRAANLLSLTHNLSVDLYADAVLGQARLIVARLLGGRGYWPYGVERILEIARAKSIPVAFLSGGDEPDAELARLSTLGPEAQHRLWQYLVHGGPANAAEFLRFAATLIGFEAPYREPRPLPRAGIYESAAGKKVAGRPLAAIVFYRALVQAGDTAAVDALLAALDRAGLNGLALFASSLKDSVAAALIEEVLAGNPPDVVLAATAFAATGADGVPPFARFDCPVLQVVFAAETRPAWQAGTRGLAPRDLAMQVALPEVDGRILTRAVAFKGEPARDPLTQAEVRRLVPDENRCAFVAAQAAAWARLRRTAPGDRRVLLVLANYPNRDGRAANGVGLDTPASAVNILRALKAEGYAVGELPADGDALMKKLLAGPTNGDPRRPESESLSFADYQVFLAALPPAVRDRLAQRWGAAESDPFFRAGEVDCGRFAVAAVRFGNVAVAIQPARGYNIDPTGSYHDPALPPPHNYLAFHAWARADFRADAAVHVGKHGNLEWLPGKALALSDACWPEVALGPLPNIYPFIVNDPGEGAQAKRRTSAVIVDHLTPPLGPAESYGPQRALESLIDEYYEASRLDPRRLVPIAEEILSICRVAGLDEDLGLARDMPTPQALQKLDSHLCELKDMQIRDGLHVFGQSPEGTLLDALLVALVRLPRGQGSGRLADKDFSLLRALAADLNLQEGFDPLDCDMTRPWDGARPQVLSAISPDPWRGAGDTVERLEALSLALVSGRARPDPRWPRTGAVLEQIESVLRPAVLASGPAEMAGLAAALAGRFVRPGPSGAPTRGRPEVLPTGKNFYSVDVRGVPTAAAWALGWKSAALLVARHAQDTGAWPRSVALSAWGTANMRTGGDDIAQALALIGAKPTWEPATGRVTGFEILPLSVMDRPRVDVTLRISGFFRDAFPGLIALFDSASRAVAALDEPAEKNPLAARFRAERARLEAGGADGREAAAVAGTCVFGSKPGAYGAGLQALIDERGWETEADLARAYVAWGGYAYDSGAESPNWGAPRHALFERRLSGVEAVLQNQDNREHDILDSDDYYQFEGGLAAAVKAASGRKPAVYHADHSRPESPKIRTLEEEIARVVRARAANPKWIAGVMRHGYKGGFEMAATVDYLFAFAATARCVKDHHFDQLFQAYLMDPAAREFLGKHNPAALKEMAARFQEALDRNLWTPRLNSVGAAIREILG